MFSLETKLYTERHTKTVLEHERTDLSKKLNEVKIENQSMAREIQRNKMFNKKDDERRAKKEEQEKLKVWVGELNKEIEEHDVQLEREKRKLDDRHLLKKQQEVTRQLKQDNNKINIDISIAESRIKDLEGLKEMTLSQIKDILTEKRKVDKENMDLEQRIQGKGVSE